MKKESINTLFLVLLVSFVIIFTSGKSISEGISTGGSLFADAPFSKFSPIGIITNFEGKEFQYLLSVPASTAEQLDNRYKKLQPPGELPFYRLPTMKVVSDIAIESNEKLEQTIIWLIGKINELEERVKKLEK